MSHELSLQCLHYAQVNPGIQPFQYKDLKALADLLDPVRADSKPEIYQFDFVSKIPKLLIVEDEDDVADVWEAILMSTGYPKEAIEVITFGPEAVTYVDREFVDVVLLDLKLVNPLSSRGEYMSGLRVLRTIRETSPHAKVILISGYATYAMVCEAILEIGATYHLQKPINVDDLRLIVQWAIDELEKSH